MIGGMKVLVIGATGMVGGAVADALEATHQVVRAARRGPVTVDLEDPSSLDALFAEVPDIDAVVCCAASGPLVDLVSAADEEIAAGVRGKLRPWRAPPRAGPSARDRAGAEAARDVAEEEQMTETVGVRLRPALARDADFLTLMLLEAFNWTGERRFGHEQVLADPKLAHYVTDWPRPGDLGVIAEDAAAGGERVGAAWARVFPPDDPGYGSVAPDVPEVSIAVAPGWRGRGLGRALLTELIGRAAANGVAGLSLSVEDGNAAARLYASLGFVTVGREGDSDTMLLRFPREGG